MCLGGRVPCVAFLSVFGGNAQMDKDPPTTASRNSRSDEHPATRDVKYYIYIYLFE